MSGSVRRLGGWWRLWILLSLVYAVAVSAYTLSEMPTMESIPDSDHFVKQLSERTLVLFIGIPQSQRHPEEVSWGGKERILEMPNHAELKVHPRTTDEEAQEIAKDYIGILERIRDEQRAALIRSALIAWFLPCLASLALGLAWEWVYQGFKQSSE